MTVDIYIKEKSGTREIRIPILPDEPSWNTGDTVFASYDIMGRGEVSVPTGTELETYSWESEFPGKGREHDPLIRGKWQDPKNYNSLLHEWKRKGIVLNLMVIGYPINRDVLLKSYTAKGYGPFGDIRYELEFVEYREIVIQTSKVQKTTTTTSRPASTANTYTVKSGDTLWGIAQKFYGSGAKWTTIYNANKDIIEKTAKKHGRSSSDNGHWIYPGTVLTIPNNPSSAKKSSTAKPTNTPTTPTTPTTTSSSSGGRPVTATTSFGRALVTNMVK